MKYLKFLPIILALAFLLYYYIGVYQPQKKVSQQNGQPVIAGQEQKQWDTKSDDQQPIAIKVTPLEMGQGAQQWRFTVVFDTHSGELNQDLMSVVSLSDDKRGTYQPTAWEGPGPGGHHREGVLVFAPVNPLPKYVELKIKDVGGIALRSFKWNIE